MFKAQQFELIVIMTDDWTTQERFSTECELIQEVESLKEDFDLKVLIYRKRDCFGEYGPWISAL